MGILGYVLTFMLVVAVLLGIFNGQSSQITKAVSDGAGEAVKLSLSMIGLMAFWSGIMEIANQSGLVSKLSAVLRPFIKLLIKDAKKDKECENAISLNITANILGLGNAATPMGIKAMKRLQKINNKSTPSKSMTFFLVLNCASIQLIPSTVAAIRAANGSITPFKIIPAVWLTSGLTLIIALVIAKTINFFMGEKNGD